MPSRDRYTCSDSHASGGYVAHYDKATGTWGSWPCLVYNYPDAIPEGAINYPQPGNPPTPPTPPTPPDPPSSDISDPPDEGYLEGNVKVVIIAACQMLVEGKEVVYDFRSKERANFTYKGTAEYGIFDNWVKALGWGPTGVDTSLYSNVETDYFGLIWGFEGDDPGSFNREYGGPFWSGILSTGVSLPKKGLLKDIPEKLGVNLGPGVTVFSGVDEEGVPNFQLKGVAVTFGGGISTSPLSAGFPADLSVGWTRYTMTPNSTQPYSDYSSMVSDILRGTSSPVDSVPYYNGINVRGVIKDYFLEGIQ